MERMKLKETQYPGYYEDRDGKLWIKDSAVDFFHSYTIGRSNAVEVKNIDIVDTFGIIPSVKGRFMQWGEPMDCKPSFENVNNNSLSMSEIKGLKENIESEICHILSKFSIDTNLEISSVELTGGQLVGGIKTLLKVDVKITL